MPDLIYYNDTGSLAIGDDSNSTQVVNAIYRAVSGKKLIVRDKEFVEIDLHTKDEKRLFPTTPIRSPYGSREPRQVIRSTPGELIAGSVANARAGGR